MSPYFQGLRVALNPQMVVPGDPVQIRRTWGERLLSWPWRPWVSTKWVPTFKPSSDVFRAGDTLVMHPDTWCRVQACLRSEADHG